MISIYNSVESPIKDIEILGNTVDGVSVGILQDDGQYKITLFTNNGLDNMSPDYREDKEELLLPCQLEKQGDSTDRLYYDKEEKAWCIYKVGQSKIVLPITFTISLNSFYGTTNLYMVSGEVEGTIKAKVSKSLGASVSSLNDKTDILIDRVSNVVEYVGNEIEKSIENKSDIGHIHQIQDVEGLEDAIEENKTSILNIENELSKSENTSYTTANGVKEFECKDGYVDNVIIEGETLVNLCYYPNLRNENSDRYFQRFDNRISGSDTYTIIIPKGKDIGFEVYNANEVGTDYGFGVSGDVGVKVVQIPTDHRIATIHCLKADCSEEELKTICETSIILKGDHTGKHISYFEGLKSVGQGDKIEVLTYQGENLFDGTYDIGYFNSVVGGYIENLATDVPTKTTKWIACKPNTLYHLIGGNRGSVQIKNNNTIIEYKGDYETQIVTPSECTHFRVYYERVGQFSLPFRIIEGKQDKKQILTTLRSLPNGVKDTIEKRGNKYYKIKRCKEIVLNGSENSWSLDSQINDITIKPLLTGFISDAKADGNNINIYCDKFVSNNIHSSTNKTEGIYYSNPLNIHIRISKSKLTTTQDVEGFKTWLSQNPVTVVYELATPIIEELPNFNPQTFEGDTTLLINSGVVQAEVSFEVTNSIGSEIEVLKGKVSGLDDNIGVLDTKITKLQSRFASSLSSLGLTDDDFSQTDLAGNLEKIIRKLGANARMNIYVYNGYMNNLNMSLKNYLGITVDGYGLDFMTTNNTACSNPIYIYPNNTTDLYILNLDSGLKKLGKVVFNNGTVFSLEEQIELLQEENKNLKIEQEQTTMKQLTLEEKVQLQEDKISILTEENEKLKQELALTQDAVNEILFMMNMEGK